MNAVPFALRYYKDSTSRFKLACVQKDAGDEIGVVDDTTGAFTALTGMPSVGGNKRWRGVVAGEQPAAYFGNNYSSDGILVTSDGVNIAKLTGTQIPDHGFVGGPYFDRLLSWEGKGLSYSRNNDPTNWSNPDTGNQMWLFVNHAEDIEAVFTPGPAKTDVGFLGKLYVCTPTSTWVHQLDFDQSGGATSTRFTCIHERAGVSSFNTVAWTDRGAVGMGVDDVWIFPLDGLPVPIGGEIVDIIKAIPSAYRTLCSATFRDGFYMLTYVRPGQTTPDREVWADLRAFTISGTAKYITWWGPMVRENIKIGCWMPQTQQPDERELFAFAADEGRCMQCEADVFTDNSEPMKSIAETVDLGEGSPTRKIGAGVILGIYVSDNDSVILSGSYDEGGAGATKTVSISSTAPRFDVATWDTATFGGALYSLKNVRWGVPRPCGSKVRLTVTHSSAQAVAIKELWPVFHPMGRIR